jgi:hypothetical protein
MTKRSKRRPIGTRALETVRPCTECKQPTEFGTAGGRPLHPACRPGFELFHPEAESLVEVEANTLAAIAGLGGKVVAVVESRGAQ